MSPRPGSPGAGAMKPRGLTRRISGSLRSRLLLSYIVLLVIALFASVLAVRQVLLVRLDDRVAEDLQQEVEEFEALAAEGVDPESGQPFGNDVKTLFDTYLERNVPDDDEELLTIPRRGTPQRLGGDNTVEFSFADFIPDWRTLEPGRARPGRVAGGGRPLRRRPCRGREQDAGDVRGRDLRAGRARAGERGGADRRGGCRGRPDPRLPRGVLDRGQGALASVEAPRRRTVRLGNADEQPHRRRGRR